MQRLFHRSVLLVAQLMSLLILNRAKKRPRLIWSHLAILPLLSLGSLGLLIPFLFTLLTTLELPILFLSGCRGGLDTVPGLLIRRFLLFGLVLGILLLITLLFLLLIWLVS